MLLHSFQLKKSQGMKESEKVLFTIDKSTTVFLQSGNSLIKLNICRLQT